MLEGVLLFMLTFMGTQHLVAETEFRISNPIFDPNCPPIHLHARVGKSVTALDGTEIPDPAPFVCGYGFFGLVPFGVFPPTGLPDQDFDGIPDALDSNDFDPDADDNNLIDGAEDPDGDGLSTATELNVTFSDPGLPDTDNDGHNDWVEAFHARDAPRFTHLMSIHGAFPFSDITVEAMSGNVDAANILLRSARVRTIATSFATDINAGDNGDGNLDAGERTASRRFFGDLFDAMGERGYYAGYAFDLGSDIGNPASATHAKRPYGFIRPDVDPDINVAYLANSIGHALGFAALASGAANELSTPFDAGLDSFIRANGLGNVEYPEEAVVATFGVGLSYQLGRNTLVVGNLITQRKDQWGRKSDPLGDATSLDMDIDEVLVQGDGDTSLKQVRILLHGDFSTAPFIRYFAFGFDTDANVSTGMTIGTAQGLDAVSQIEVQREKMGGPLILGHAQIDVGNFLRAPGRPPSYSKLEYFAPFTTQPTTASPGALLKFDMDLTGVSWNNSVSTIPAAAFSQDFADLQNNTADDQVDFPFHHRDVELRPAIEAGGAYGAASEALSTSSMGAADPGAPLPGDTVNVMLARLTPSTPFDVLVDDLNVLSDTTDASGNYMGQFTLPVELAPGNYFLTALDQAGEFAGSAIVVPEPALRGLGLGALVALCWVRRLRKA